MAKLLIIGAGWEQLELIKTAESQGHFVVATNPLKSASGFKFADVSRVVQSTDILTHLELINEFDIEGIVTDNCDYSLFTASVLCNLLGFPGPSISSARFSTNKLEQRKKCHQSQIKQPEFKEVLMPSDIETFAEEIGYPLVIKPIDNRGNFGVSIIRNQSEISNAFIEAISNAPSRRVVCEQFVDGNLVTIDGFCFKNGHKTLAIAKNVSTIGRYPVNNQICYPANFSDRLSKKLMDFHDKTVAALGYDYGHTHGEYMITESEEVFLIECSNRGGGIYISSIIVPEISAIDTNLALINASIGKAFDLQKINPKKESRSFLLGFHKFQEGKKVEKLSFDETMKRQKVKRLQSIYKPGDQISEVINGAQRHVILLIEAENEEEALIELDAAKNSIKVEYA